MMVQDNKDYRDGFRTLWQIVKLLLIGTGIMVLIMMILAFTSAPFWIWYSMGVSRAGIDRSPDFIVVLGGGGIPSETGLMRTYYAREAAEMFPQAAVIVALPGNEEDSMSSVSRMRQELILRGVDSDRILVEDSGTNTRSQALLIKELITSYELRVANDDLQITNDDLRLNRSPEKLSIFNCPYSILLITSPEHLYRAVKTFEKAGFKEVGGMPAFESAIESDISYSSRKLGGRKWVPDVGDSINLRYQFWTQLHYEALVIREGLAIAYYWLMGWI